MRLSLSDRQIGAMLESEGINRWLTLGANLAVFVGIVLLIFELSENREMMRAQTRHDMAMGIVELQRGIAENEQLADVLYRGYTGEELSPSEQFQLRTILNAILRYWEDVHYQYRLGLYDEPEFSRQREAWRELFSTSSKVRSYWCEVRGRYSNEFVLELDALLPDNAC